MGKPLFHIRARVVAEGLKVEVIISPSLVDEVVAHDYDWAWTLDRAYLEFEVEGAMDYAPFTMSVERAVEDFEYPDLMAPPEWDVGELGM